MRQGHILSVGSWGLCRSHAPLTSSKSSHGGESGWASPRLLPHFSPALPCISTTSPPSPPLSPASPPLLHIHPGAFCSSLHCHAHPPLSIDQSCFSWEAMVFLRKINYLSHLCIFRPTTMFGLAAAQYVIIEYTKIIDWFPSVCWRKPHTVRR